MRAKDAVRGSTARIAHGPRRTLLVAGTFLLGGLVVLVDQGTKAWAEATLSTQERIPLVGELLGLQLAYNPGAAFSFGEGSTWVFALVAVAAAVAAVVLRYVSEQINLRAGIVSADEVESESADGERVATEAEDEAPATS